MVDRSTGRNPEAGRGSSGDERSADGASDRAGISLRGIQLVVRTLGEAPLHHTARLYPHVINKLALAWHQNDAFDAVVDELLFTQRPNRKGFPPAVLRELLDLRSLHERRNGKAGLSAGSEDYVTDAESLRRRLLYIRPPKR